MLAATAGRLDGRLGSHGDEDRVDGPEMAVETYVQAVDDDVAAANAVVHEESHLAVDEGAVEGTALTLRGVERRSLRATLRARGIVDDQLGRRRREEEERLAELSDEPGFDDHAFVYVSISPERYGEEEHHPLVVEVDGEWPLLE